MMDWWIEISGENIDLMDWEQQLRRPFNPFVENTDVSKNKDGSQELYLLQAEEFADCLDANSVRAKAVPLIRHLNGIFAALRDNWPVEMKSVYRKRSDGAFERHSFLSVESAKFRIHGSAVSLNSSVQCVPNQSFVQHALADADDSLKDALEHFSRADNWYDLYKSFEALGKKQGLKQLELSKNTKDNLLFTFQKHRHDKIPVEPKKELNFEVARKIIADVVALRLENISKNTS